MRIEELIIESLIKLKLSIKKDYKKIKTRVRMKLRFKKEKVKKLKLKITYIYFIINIFVIQTFSTNIILAQNAKKLNVITSSTDLASIANEIGKDKVEATSLSQGKDDLHYLSARPDYILKLNRAQVLVYIGGSLEISWLPEVINSARNSQVDRGGVGHCNTSTNLLLLNKPVGIVTRMLGDIHPEGNPHYWTDPLYGIKIAEKITSCLSKVDPDNITYYNKNLKVFTNKAKNLNTKLQKLFKKHANVKFLDYHDEFLYISKRYNLKIIDHIEEKPGVPPSIGRKNLIIEKMKQQKIKYIITTPWNDLGVCKSIAEKVNGKVIVLPVKTNSAPNTDDYLKTIETWSQILNQALLN